MYREDNSFKRGQNKTMALGDRWNNFWDSWGGNDSDPYEEDYYGVGGKLWRCF